MLQLQSIYFGQKHREFDYKDMEVIKQVRRLSRKHDRQCVNDCNGSGYVGSQFYYTGMIDDYAKQTYGVNVKSGFIGDDEDSIFYHEIKRLELRIHAVINKTLNPFTVQFQHDPRGNTVKLFYDGDYVDIS